jgi:hypothetical protein
MKILKQIIDNLEARLNHGLSTPALHGAFLRVDRKYQDYYERLPKG